MRKRVYYTSGNLNPFLSKINDILIDINLSPTSLSTKAGLGSSTVSNLLKRNNIPTVSTLVRICAVLGIRVSAFFQDLEENYPELFHLEHSGIQRHDPLLKRKNQIIEEFAALPVSDRNEMIERMLNEYVTPNGKKSTNY
jgi:transcriptional regulator with XRE-family HTH domain